MVLLTFNVNIYENGVVLNQKHNQDSLIKAIEEKTEVLLLLLELHEFQATFFIEISIAERLEKLLKKISFNGHEIALYNINSTVDFTEITKQNIEDILDKPIRGLRQKQHQFSYQEIQKMEFKYVSEIDESSINFLWRKLTSRTYLHIENDVNVIPESQSPYSQLPFNDYVLQVTPMKYYENMLLESLKNNDYVMIYANAWQLFSSSESPFRLPFYKKINNGRKFEDRLEQLFQFIDENEIAVARMKDYLF